MSKPRWYVTLTVYDYVAGRDTHRAYLLGTWRDERWAYLAAGRAMACEPTRSICVWTDDRERGGYRCATSLTSHQVDPSWWISAAGEYEAVIAHEVWLAQAPEKDPIFGMLGMREEACQAINLQVDEARNLGFDVAIHGSSASTAGDGLSAVLPQEPSAQLIGRLTIGSALSVPANSTALMPGGFMGEVAAICAERCAEDILTRMGPLCTPSERRAARTSLGDYLQSAIETWLELDYPKHFPAEGDDNGTGQTAAAARSDDDGGPGPAGP